MVAARSVHRRAGFGRDDTGHDHGLSVAANSSVNYHRWVSDLCRPYLGPSVLEVGAGHGAITRFLAPDADRYVATDITPACLAALNERFGSNPHVEVRHLDLRAPDVEGEFDTILLMNVLEHIYDDEATLRDLGKHLTTTGYLIIYGPALDSLYGSWDRRIGHFRRYTKRRLSGVIEEAGLAVETSRYLNALSIPPWFAFSRLGLHRLTSAPNSAPGRELDLWDRTGVPVSRWIESRFEFPIGLNLFCVARHP